MTNAVNSGFDNAAEANLDRLKILSIKFDNHLWVHSTSLKLDTFISGLAIGLIALGARGMHKLRVRSIMPSVSWLQRPSLPYASMGAGLGLFSLSTMAKIWGFTKLDEGIRINRSIKIEDYARSFPLSREEGARILANKY